ncbi:MAG: hypothetical protein AB8G14_05485 [Ilumatobacter sp.]
MPATARSNRSAPDVADVATAAIEMPSATQLAAEPRFSVLIELMERLTGREIKLLPPASVMFGARKHVEGSAPAAAPQVSGGAEITGVRPLEGGQVFRIDTTAALDDGGQTTAAFDVGMDMIQDHGDSRGERTGPLRVHVSADAVVSHPTEPLRLESGGNDAVRVTPHVGHVDKEA